MRCAVKPGVLSDKPTRSHAIHHEKRGQFVLLCSACVVDAVKVYSLLGELVGL